LILRKREELEEEWKERIGEVKDRVGCGGK
jgi:hypothetical protein